MSVFTGVVTYFLIWWTALFVVLPFGVRPHEKSGPATSGGAPEHPDLKRKILATTILSGVIWGVVYALVVHGTLDFRGISGTMMAEDLRK